ncbi:chromosome segregation in meiosis-related protein [Lecanora helva]
MAAVDIGARNGPPVPAADDLDDLFNYDVGDAFRDIDTNIDISTQPKPPNAIDANGSGAGLGIDEEIKVTKKRRPVPKLDEERLLGPAGIPRLRRITKDRLRFKGKGHEYSDVTRLLNVFQLWLDDLYPRAKFADGLAIIEKLGHTKRMQTMRKEWIDEGKTVEKPSSLEQSSKQKDANQLSRGLTSGIEPAPRVRTPVSDENNVHSGAVAARPTEAGHSPSRKGDPAESLFISDDEDPSEQPPEDDLDALLAEDQANSAAMSQPITNSVRRADEFDDEMEAMANMDDMW